MSLDEAKKAWHLFGLASKRILDGTLFQATGILGAWICLFEEICMGRALPQVLDAEGSFSAAQVEAHVTRSRSLALLFGEFCLKV